MANQDANIPSLTINSGTGYKEVLVGVLGVDIDPSFTGILDTYPNAALAVSVRKLRLVYSGSCIRVRRSSDNTEQDIGFSSNALDTATLLTFVGAGDGFVTKFYDQSGNNNHLVQTTAGNQPKIVSGGVLLTLVGKPCIQLDGTDDFWSLTSSIVSAVPWSSFQVSRKPLSGVIGPMLSSNSANAPFTAMDYTDNGIYISAAGTAYNTAALLTPDVQYLITSIRNGSGGFIWRNNASIAVSNFALADAGSFTRFGNRTAAQFSNGFVQEYILYSSDQTSNRNGINTAINSYFTVY